MELLPNKSAALIVGRPRGEKSIFANQFLADGIKDNDSTVYVVSNTFPENITERLVRAVGNNDIKNFRIVDCYTVHSGIDKIDDEIILRVSGPYALHEISIALTKLVKAMNMPFRIVFDSLSTLLLHNKLNEIEEFLQLNIRKLKRVDATILFLIEEGMHNEKEFALLETLTDITLRFNSDEKIISYKKFGEETRIKYRLEDGRIDLEAM